jgi:tetratricopeptide (TPR) repeat protein
MLLSISGRKAEAEVLYLDVLPRYRRVLGDDHPDTIVLLHNVSSVLLEQGRFSEAEPYLREAIERAQRTLGDDHPQTMMLVDHLGVLLWKLGNASEAETVCRDAVQRMRRALGDEHPQTLTAIGNLTAVLQLQGKTAEAESLYGVALVNLRRVLGDDHPDTLKVLNNLVYLLESEQRFADALPMLEELYRRAGASELPAPQVALFTSRYGPALVRLGRYEEAEDPLRRAYERLKSADLSGERRMRVVVEALAEVCDHTARPDEAARWRAELAALIAATQPATAPAP